MTPTPPTSTGALWARFRFAVVGTLLSSPPPRGALKATIDSLAARTWTHPTTGRDVQFSAVTIERWYYRARRGHDDPVAVLRRAVRKDCGKILLASALAERLVRQYRDYPHLPKFVRHRSGIAMMSPPTDEAKPAAQTQQA